MSNYVKATNFTAKDSLPTGDSGKIVKGTEIDVELSAIAAAISSKSDSNSPTFTGTPLAPTASAATNNTQIATTAYADAAVVAERTATATLTNKSLTSPTLTGVPTAPTAASGTNTTQLATTAFVQAALQAVYPVGSIYINATSATNPATLLGFGTWIAFGAGRVMVGLNGSDALFDTAEETGGSKDNAVVSHTHTFSTTTASNGSHQHFVVDNIVGGNEGGLSSSTTIARRSAWASDFSYDFGTSTDPADVGLTSSAGTHTHTLSGTTGSTGSSGTNANLQPYIVVRMWKRTA